jgi:hypothetical protein
MEITISGIGTSGMSASALPVPPGPSLPSGPSYALAPVEEGGRTGIQLKPLATGSFTHGERGQGGVRYVYATYRVRNASVDGTPYTTPRKNLTFLAANTAGTLGRTAISRLDRFDGRALDALVATGIQPTGAAMESSSGAVASRYPDVLQVLTEAELAQIQAQAPPGVELFPYGFVVRHATSPTTRTLAPAPAPGDFEGVVTFAFKLPLQSTAAEDPFTVSAIFQAVDDGETRITQSLEEQTPAGETAFLARAEALGASMKSVLPGQGSYWGEAQSTRTVCSVRTAGSSATPAGYLVQVPVAGVSFTNAGPFAMRPLWVGGRMARPLDFAARDGSGNLRPDVPAHLSTSGTGVLSTWGRGSVRMHPRLDRAEGVVSATACGHTASTQVRASGYSPLAAGMSHSVVLRPDGTVVAWGWNDYGQIDVPSDLTDVVQVAAGGYHSLALRSNGTVVGWGWNRYDQARTHMLSRLGTVVQVAAGSTHSIALGEGGTVVAWGQNEHAQATVPLRLTDVVQIAAGRDHSLALKADGTVVAWGRNYYGESDVPEDLTDAVQIAAGMDHSLALRADGTVVGWGGYYFDEASPPAGLRDVVQIATGDRFSLALQADGTVVAWGDNSYGQIDVPADLADVVQVSAGNFHALALRADGSVVGWGANFYGESTVPGAWVAAVP